MFKKIDRRLTYIEGVVERIEDNLDKVTPHVETDIPFTEVEITWANKGKGLIVCNRCHGTGRIDNRYGYDSTCNFCDGKKVIKLVDHSKAKK